jgi:hypothetical protein
VLLKGKQSLLYRQQDVQVLEYLSWIHHFGSFTVTTMNWLTVMVYICVTNDHGYVPLVVSTHGFFPNSWLIIGFVTRLTRRVPLVEQGLLTLQEHLSTPPVFIVVRGTRSLALCVYSFCFGHCVVCPSLCGFWLPLWHLQALLKVNLNLLAMNI